MNFFEQLNGGIRYIDFRAGYDGTAWHSFHFEEGPLCSVLISDIARFLAQSTHEVVVIEVSHTSGKCACTVLDAAVQWAIVWLMCRRPCVRVRKAAARAAAE